ncbi:MAG: hypothetical protein Ct9H300mP4_16580 [Gammaproteobacteria bacterium]|nr:MAG: hypothetical protein Ct9H300mP4_16580 [Gammaproteobacteria bacterium]
MLNFASKLVGDLDALGCFACLDRLRFSQYSESSGLVASKTALASGVGNHNLEQTFEVLIGTTTNISSGLRRLFIRPPKSPGYDNIIIMPRRSKKITAKR